MIRVSGSRRDPVPPARTTPFTPACYFGANRLGTLSAVARDDIERLHDELEDIFSALWQGPRFSTQRRGFRPDIDVFRTAEPNELRILVDLAGVDPADVRIAVHELALVIAGHRRRPETQSRPSYHLMEVEYGPFERRIALPEPVDPRQANATYERGLLTIVLPVTTTAPPRRTRISIEVRTIA